ncbi:ankyrin repeat, PH and SEC7 domain containing protein secG-like [Ruditapes philippinarum]|uniref:ankyrin repeat, PH and SEC7 domain containing protein secG-like n=1 Tax=Ruditapes philippinarum TaxID=129788 RepID=UPI00295C046D|nr:ankyrin repeat, PH and SEC7 domain containing protein secG-like [Ruditapes philippinarum]
MSRKRCDINLKDIEDEKRLVEVTKLGNYEEVDRLLQCGVSPDTTEYNRQLFYQSENYMTPLHFATARGFPELLKLFISKGANVNAKDRFDVTPLHTAAELGHEECLALLLKGGADCNISTKYSKHGSYTAVPHPGGTTPLHLASANNHVSCVKLLIWNGADYNAVDERCRTSLYLAAQQGLAQCVHAHLDNAIWKDILSLPEKHTGDTPLHECVRKNLLDCIVKLLERGSDVNHLNHAGFSPLHLAICAGENFNIEIVKSLIVKGYNTNVNLPETSNCFTPLHYVCFNDAQHQERRPDVAVLLLAYGANYNIRNKHGDSVLVSELRGRHRDTTILSAIAKCMTHLPSLDALGLGAFHANQNPLMMPPPLHSPPPVHLIRQDHQDIRQHQINMARLWSENQQAKFAWYKEMLKGPRSLQHYCRCVIRNSMGPKRLRKIDVLPLPTTMKEFLLLEHEEFR